MKKLLLVTSLVAILTVLSACSDSVAKVEEGPYKGFRVVKVIDKYANYKGMDYVVEVEVDGEYSSAEVPKEIYKRVEIGGKVYYKFFLQPIIKVPSEGVAE